MYKCDREKDENKRKEDPEKIFESWVREGHQTKAKNDVS